MTLWVWYEAERVFADSPLWVLRMFCAGNALKCLGSTAAHTYCCMSYRVKNLMWQGDYLGIFVYAYLSAIAQALFGRRGTFLRSAASVDRCVPVEANSMRGRVSGRWAWTKPCGGVCPAGGRGPSRAGACVRPVGVDQAVRGRATACGDH